MTNTDRYNITDAPISAEEAAERRRILMAMTDYEIGIVFDRNPSLTVRDMASIFGRSHSEMMRILKGAK